MQDPQSPAVAPGSLSIGEKCCVILQSPLFSSSLLSFLLAPLCCPSFSPDLSLSLSLSHTDTQTHTHTSPTHTALSLSLLHAITPSTHTHTHTHTLRAVSL